MLSDNHLRFYQFTYHSRETKLTCDGEIVEMRNKLHQILNYFLERPNEIISKDALLDAIWQHGEYRERSLAQSLLELRKVLGDSATSPKFIRTIPNQGFIWIAPIESVAAKSKDKMATPFFPTVLVLICALALLITLLTAFWPKQDVFSFNVDRKLKVAVLPFNNNTEQASFQWVEFGLSDMLATDLIQFPGIEVINPSETASTSSLGQMNWQEKQADVVIDSDFSLNGNSQVLTFKLTAADGSHVSGQYSDVDLAVAMPKLASKIHQLLKPDSLIELDTYHWHANAMHEYAKGQQAMAVKGCELAQHYFSAAVVIDPNHHWSQLSLAFCQLELQQTVLANKTIASLTAIKSDKSFDSLLSLAKAHLYVQQQQFDKAKSAIEESQFKQVLSNNAQWLALGLNIEQKVINLNR